MAGNHQNIDAHKQLCQTHHPGTAWYGNSKINSDIISAYAHIGTAPHKD